MDLHLIAQIVLIAIILVALIRVVAVLIKNEGVGGLLVPLGFMAGGLLALIWLG